MTYHKYHLKEFFSQLGNSSVDPTLTVYLPDLMVEMGRKGQRRPCLLICPGGAYGWCSQREAEPVAVHFLPEGFNVFVLNYSVAPSRFPTQLREVAAAMELIYRNAEDWSCDVNRIAIMGFSAGGHLAAHYSTWPPTIPPASIGPRCGRSSRRARLFRHPFFATPSFRRNPGSPIWAALKICWATAP